MWGYVCRNPFLKASSVLVPAEAPAKGQSTHWPLALSVPPSPSGPPETRPPSRRGTLSPCSTSAQNHLMAQWLASDLPISPHLKWLQPSPGRPGFALLGQQACPPRL